MSEFKEGDIVYGFDDDLEYPAINLNSLDIFEEHWRANGLQQYRYKSRREALEALAKRLNELLKDEQCL